MIGFIVGLAMFGAIIFLPLYLQIVQGASPTQAGLQMIPMMVGLLSMSILSGRLISRIGRYKPFPIIGTVLATIAMWMFSTIEVDTPYWRVALAMFVLGAGLGNVMQVLVIAVQNSVHPREIGVATSGTTFFRSIGGTFGTAVFGAIMTSQLAAHIAEQLPAGASAGVDTSQLTSAMSTIAGLPPEVHQVVLNAFSQSLATVFLVAVPITALGFVLSLLLPDVRLHGMHDRSDDRAEAAAMPAPLD
jgi:MFS family permease